MTRFDSATIPSELLKALVEHAPDMVSLTDGEGVVRFEGPAVLRVLGYTPEELTGLGVLDLVHPDDQERAGELFGYLVTHAGAIVTAKIRYRHKSGSWRTLEVVARNLLDNPQVEGVVINSRDITDRETLESQIEESRRLASMGRLAAAISHEVNNLLMGIQPVAEMLLRKKDDPQMARLSRVLQQAIDRGRIITSQLLGFGRKVTTTLAPINISQWLREFEEEITPVMGQVELSTAGEDLVLLSDPTQLHQIMLNLVLNARDAMNGAGKVRISVSTATVADQYYPLLPRREEGFVRICVTDDGPGMPAEIREHVFEPFFTTKKTGGGLGLWLVHQVVQQQGGVIVVDSEPGKGTTFTLFFPQAADVSEPAAPAHSAGVA